MSFPLTVPNRTSKGGLDFSLQSSEFYRVAYSLKSEKDFAKLYPATMCPEDQQTSDNLIVKDNCFIIEILAKCSLVPIGRIKVLGNYF